MCSKCHDCFITVSVITKGAQSKFEDNERLRQNTIKSVSVRAAGGQTKKNPQGVQLAADAVLFSSHLVLRNGNAAAMAEIPVENLVRNANAPEPLCVNWSKIDPTQSYVIVDTTAAGYNAAHCIEFVFELDCTC